MSKLHKLLFLKSPGDKGEIEWNSASFERGNYAWHMSKFHPKKYSGMDCERNDLFTFAANCCWLQLRYVTGGHKLELPCYSAELIEKPKLCLLPYSLPQVIAIYLFAYSTHPLFWKALHFCQYCHKLQPRDTG